MDLNKYINKHGTGYIIKKGIIKDNELLIDTVVSGKAQLLPNSVNLTENHIFDIASLTKFFTSIITHKTIERGLLNLNDIIYDIDNRFINLRDVTILDLISHRIELWTDGYLGKASSKEEFYNMLFNSKVKSRKRMYVDSHYMILSILLEKIYDLPYAEILDNEIVKALNLKNTSFTVKDKSMAVSNNYELVNGKIIDNVYPGTAHDPKARTASSFGIQVGHAGIFTTSDDLMEVLISFIDDKERLLKSESIKRMLTHDDIDMEIKQILYNFAQSKGITIPDLNLNLNELFLHLAKNYNDKEELALMIPKTYNYSGTRYLNPISKRNDIPLKASPKTIIFSGYTGPIFLIDFDKSIIILIMTNVCHNSKLNRTERYDMSVKLINEIYNDIVTTD